MINSSLLKADGGGHHADKKHSNINVQVKIIIMMFWITTINSNTRIKLIKAAILHALGDLLCSIGVLVASMVIM